VNSLRPLCCGSKSESEKEKCVYNVQESLGLKILPLVEETSLILVLRSPDAQVLVQAQRQRAVLASTLTFQDVGFRGRGPEIPIGRGDPPK
jgi:hypothetical protein